MRKLWPPTRNDSSVRCWAAIVSATINMLLWASAFFGSQTAFWWLIPGFIPAFAVSAMVGYDVEGPVFPVVGLIMAIAANFGFYYLTSWVLINMFRPATNWWPEKRA